MLACKCAPACAACIKLWLTIVEHVAGLSSMRARRAQVLATVHPQAERMYPPKPTSKLVHDAHRRHNYDHEVDYEDVVTQRYYSLTVAWERLLHHIAHDVDMQDDDFAFIFEDDIALHDNLTHSDARRAVLRGMDLAREDGLLYLGGCWPSCSQWDRKPEWTNTVKFEKCSNMCTHALAVTKRKAATLMAQLRESMVLAIGEDGHWPYGYVIDQMLHMYSKQNNGTWTVGSNMLAPGNDVHIGIFYQNRKAFHSTIGNPFVNI